ncbi:DUF3465 domain-containing protein [Crocinitomix catalasitica]|uniref:DUF3465 domain-containing protein n=1 Tax=Crocinitomix catalasitica TaxID=184607 RepID=UPI000A7E5C80|nr:DUF3465 domain-containing protein [Crocinitomix catalasitica]
MKKYYFYIAAAMVVMGCEAGSQDSQLPAQHEIEQVSTLEFTDLKELYNAQVSNAQVLIQGEIIALLPDDNEGSRHQKFIVKLASGQTVLIVHNIDLAPRINSIEKGEQVLVYGEYEYNDKGGLIHWTHDDPQNRHEHGYIEYQGLKYQ